MAVKYSDLKIYLYQDGEVFLTGKAETKPESEPSTGSGTSPSVKKDDGVNFQKFTHDLDDFVQYTSYLWYSGDNFYLFIRPTIGKDPLFTFYTNTFSLIFRAVQVFFSKIDPKVPLVLALPTDVNKGFYTYFYLKWDGASYGYRPELLESSKMDDNELLEKNIFKKVTLKNKDPRLENTDPETGSTSELPDTPRVETVTEDSRDDFSPNINVYVRVQGPQPSPISSLLPPVPSELTIELYREARSSERVTATIKKYTKGVMSTALGAGAIGGGGYYAQIYFGFLHWLI